MQLGQPSSTAERAARLRAAHQLFDQPRILEDPVVLRLIGPDAEARLRAHPEVLEQPGLRRLRLAMAVRSRYAEDCLGDAIRRGVGQYVILGAGLDSFAYRNPYSASELRVYEVDHPDTQAWKRRCLADAGIELPGSLTFVPIDFERDALTDALQRGGLNSSAPAFVSWLGVTVYLTREAVLTTLAGVAALAAGSEIVFSYVTTPEGQSESTRSVLSAVAQRAEAVGEPWLSFFDPADLAREVGRLGFAHVEDFGPAEAAERYFRGRSDGLRSGGLGRLMKARLPS